MKSFVKNIKINRFNGKLIGMAVFLNKELIEDYVINPKDNYLSVEIENTKTGILIKPLDTWNNEDKKGLVEPVVCG